MSNLRHEIRNFFKGSLNASAASSSERWRSEHNLDLVMIEWPSCSVCVTGGASTGSTATLYPLGGVFFYSSTTRCCSGVSIRHWLSALAAAGVQPQGSTVPSEAPTWVQGRPCQS